MNYLLILLVACLAVCNATAQQCPGNIFQNPGVELGVPTTNHQDIDNAHYFSRLWEHGSTADIYDANTAPGGWSPPTPQTGNYASCWIANYDPTLTTYREGFQVQLQYRLPPNTGSYNITFETACLGGWGTAAIGVYGIYNPNNLLGAQPTGSHTPTNVDLFGAANTVLLSSIPVTSCSNSKVTQSLVVNTNAANYPPNGISHIMITHDGTPISGGRYMAFDNFCTEVNPDCPAPWNLNGDLESGAAASGNQYIDNAAHFSKIWARGSLADYYTATSGPFASILPTPQTGNYVSCWIANFAGATPQDGLNYREGFQSELATKIMPNSGTYKLEFDMACLNAWGDVELAVYGVTGFSGDAPNSPTSAFLPDNMNLFGPANTVLLGTIPLSSGNCSNVKTRQGIIFNSNLAGFPAAGIGRFMVTRSDNSNITGAHYIAFDNFCLQAFYEEPCPEITDISVSCDPDAADTYILDITTTGTGTINLATACGAVSPFFLTVNGNITSTVVLTSPSSCGTIHTINYHVSNVSGSSCDQGSFTVNRALCDPTCACTDADFYSAVYQGFNSVLNCPDDIHTPISLSDCDRVDWYMNGNYLNSTNGNDPLTIPHILGTYELCMFVTRTDPLGRMCQYSSCTTLEGLACLSGRTNVSNAVLGASPNPTKEDLHLTWSTASIPDDITVTITNASGVKVFQQVGVNGPSGHLTIDVRDLASGLYIVQIQGANYDPAPYKFVKE